MRSFLFLVLASMAFSAAWGQTHSYEGDTKTQPLTRAGKDLVGDETLPVVTLNTFVYEVRDTEKEFNKVVYDCEEVETDGTAGNWEGFWTAPKAFKAVHLQQAIKGLDNYSAKRLVKDGTFESKPRSWADFESRIEAASQRYHNAFAYHVLIEYKEENIRNLGYLTQSCGHHWERTIEHVRERISSEPRSLRAQVRVHGSVLLPTEKETYTVIFDGFQYSLRYDSDVNTYRAVETVAADGLVRWDLYATRKMEAPANTLDLRLTNLGNHLAILVTDQNFDREADATGSRKIVATVVRRRKVWDPRSDVVMASFERTLDNNYRDTAIDDLGITLPRGKIQVRYTIRYENSPYYSAEESTRKMAELKN